uniref:Fibrinogen C-terminal domain-containing protein n=1 Tax=Caenorhabditis tropicalis TaxID=1561998 RepID=A0A1I7V3W4_9PELO
MLPSPENKGPIVRARIVMAPEDQQEVAKIHIAYFTEILGQAVATRNYIPAFSKVAEELNLMPVELQGLISRTLFQPPESYEYCGAVEREAMEKALESLAKIAELEARIQDLERTAESSGDEKELLMVEIKRLRESLRAITQRYTFGIPEVHANCICECDATASTCTAESHQFTACPESDKSDESTSCYRTFFPNQTPIGCSEDDSPKLCCDVRFKPYKNMTFLAVKLEQPTTYATFVYAAYDFVNGYWVEKDKTTIRSQLDGGTQDRHLDSKRRISLAVTAGGRASHQLETGMYFSRTSNGGETEELRMQPLNEITDNNFDRLGWYRMDETGHFHVNNGVVKMDDIHKAKVKNCKEQTYRSILAANNYVGFFFGIFIR